MAGAGEVECVAFRRVLELHGGLILLLGIANSAHLPNQILPFRPRHELRQLSELLEFRYEPRLRLRRRSAVLVKKVAMALVSVPPEAKPPETAAAAAGIRRSVVVAVSGVVCWDEDGCLLRLRHVGIYDMMMRSLEGMCVVCLILIEIWPLYIYIYIGVWVTVLCVCVYVCEFNRAKYPRICERERKGKEISEKCNHSFDKGQYREFAHRIKG